MTTDTARVVDLFAEAGVIAFRQGALTEALHEMAVRIDLAGGGDLLAEFARTCWGPHSDACRCKGTPDPRPVQPPKPPPPPKSPGK